ncbi:MAG: hypothetical protein M3376_11315 [Actinomycetota bacterium]|nr:hypothetical protein [Actinomycetota bacterium]
MDDDDRVHLDVAFELDGDAIRGTVADGLAPAREFAGWLELLSAFETARSKARADADAKSKSKAKSKAC